MKQLLIGIWDDGSARDELMPRSSATTLVIASGENHTIDLRVFFPSAVPVDLGVLSGLSVELVVNCTVDPCQRIPDRTFTAALPSDPVGNLARFEIPFSAFRGVNPARYLFEAWLRQPTQRVQVVRTSAWVLTPALIR